MSAATNLRNAAEAIAADTPEIHAPSTLAEALVAALADLSVIEPARTADLGTYSYRYAGLADIVKKTRPALARYGLVALTPLSHVGSELACSVVIVHESGDRMEFGPFTFPHGRDAQATGSMVTYMRRYALVAALGMAAGDDDDGAAAQPRQAEFVWTAGACKARLIELLDGDKGAAKEAWVLGKGDELTEFSSEIADRLAQEWRDNQPPDDPEAA